MKRLFVIGAGLLLASQFICKSYAIELCEPQDYYNLADSSKCTINDNKAVNQNDPRELMFETLKNYPYEHKDRFLKLLQRKIELVDNYLKQQQGQNQTEKSNVSIGKLEQSKRELFEQLEIVTAATADNWVSVRNQATSALREAAKRLQEVE